MRLRSCKYCGRVHPVDYDCGRKPVRKKNGSREAEKIRSSYAWQKKRERVKERDHFLCRWSLAQGKIVTKELEVHHITPIDEAPELALEEDNLITLTSTVHERAERGDIDREELRRLARIPPYLPGAKK